MSSELVLYTHPMSRGRIARWMLEEVGEPYTAEIVGFGESMKSATYRAINPMGKVPALRHGDMIVTETAAICTYLADAFPSAALAPPTSSRDRGSYYRWLFFAAGPLEAAVTNKAAGFVLPPERRGMAGYGSLEAVMDTIEGALAGREFLVGEGFTTADLYLGSHIGWGMMFGTVEKRPAFVEYHARLARRPAAVRANLLDDALLEKHSTPSAKS